ncbi:MULTISPECIES: hypothetical protein [Brevibacillus]|uniref:hypothetical protein n=1 Tax=Brevibacillus TaxID=55080 RepID=UPI000D0FB425|nr:MULTISPECIES: hypothetical protein [Brevibacillus]PSJ68204.1 hypothetical protein C7J99_17550 [Brevibacillus brevis]RED35703.1 hypothetical protein DES34_101362 [Brevibacillus brevis]TQK53412.1 hypothetical protein FB479_11049 [Brevibacillus sp. AG162]VEF89186.1 Uncharacterised protein [Brevibacillus brevis]GEC89246.1 hypothetical protein BBR01nite_15770 [Brevibacillus brevis]
MNKGEKIQNSKNDTKQNMSTFFITGKKEDTEAIHSDNLEIDSDVNEDPKRETLLDDSLHSFLDHYMKG